MLTELKSRPANVSGALLRISRRIDALGQREPLNEEGCRVREQLQRRLEALKQEFNVGRRRATELEQQQATLHQTLLRISGAIQVLEEELRAQPQDAALNNGTLIGDAAQADLNRVNGSREHVGI